MAQSVIEDFLVRLGFDVDKASQARFKTSLGNVSKNVAHLAKRALAIGTAFATVATIATKKLDSIYQVSRNTNASFENIRALSYAFESVGGSAADAQGAVTALANQLKYTPNIERILGTQYGVNIRRANGQLKDTGQILMEVRASLMRIAKTDQVLARAKAQAIGLGGAFDMMMRSDFGAYYQRSAESMRGFSKEMREGADYSHKMMAELDLLTSSGLNSFSAALGSIAKESGFLDWLKDVTNALPSLAQSFIDFEKKGLGKGFWYFLGHNLVDWRDPKTYIDNDAPEAKSSTEDDPQGSFASMFRHQGAVGDSARGDDEPVGWIQPSAVTANPVAVATQAQSVSPSVSRTSVVNQTVNISTTLTSPSQIAKATESGTRKALANESKSFVR